MKIASLGIFLSGCMLSQHGLAAVEVPFWYSGGIKPQEMMITLINEFNQCQQEYVIKPSLQGNYSETFQKLQAGLASNTAPALALLESSQADSMTKRGLVRDLRPYIDQSFQFNDFIPAFRSQVTAQDGGVYGLPAYGTTQILYYNKDLLTEKGINPERLKTWQGLAEVAKQVAKKNDKGETVFYGWEPMWGQNNMIDAALSNGAELISADGKTVLIDSPAWVTVWEGFRQWLHQDKVMRIHHGGQGWEYWYKTIDDVMKGRALGYTGSSGDQGDLDFTRIAAAPQPGWGDHPARPQAGALVMVIPKNIADEVAKGAFEFLRFYTSAKNTARWSMHTGYIPVRESVQQVAEYNEFTTKNPHALMPLLQARIAASDLVDPTNGKILDALAIAADKVQIENIPAETALKEAAKKAQRELNKVNRQ